MVYVKMVNWGKNPFGSFFLHTGAVRKWLLSNMHFLLAGGGECGLKIGMSPIHERHSR